MKARNLIAALATAFLWCAGAAAHPPYGLVADARGNLYFSDLETVWRLAPDRRLTVFRPHAGGHVHELTLAPDGAIEGDQNHYEPAGEKHFTAIWRRSLGGEEKWVGPLTTDPPFGMGLAQDGAGRRYSGQWVSNDDRRLLLLRRSRDGRVEVLLGREAMPDFRQRSLANVGGMAFAADGALVFADGPRLHRLAPDGRVSTLLDTGSPSSLRGIATADGRVYAADMGRKRVLAIDAKGGEETVWRSEPRWMPTGVARIGDALFVLEAEDDPEHRSNRVRGIEVSGGKGAVVAEPWKGETSPAPAPTRGTSRRSLAPVGAAVAIGVALWLTLRRRG